MNTSCQIFSTVQQDSFWFITAQIIVAVVIIFLLWKVIRLIGHTEENKLVRITGFILSIIASVVLFVIASVVAVIVLYLIGLIHDDHPPSVDYHVLNAAIKNTCFLDPQKNHCPKTAQDIIDIEPENFSKLTKNANLTYQYYLNTNEYTLIVRNNDLKKDDYRVAIFDPRLTTVKNYGRGVDFLDTEIMWCNGKYVLKNPPPFPGPWDKIN